MTYRHLLSGTILAELFASSTAAERNFNRIASVSVTANFSTSAPDETSAEIIDFSEDGMTLVYSD